jgi:hypothetical protein
MDGQTLLNISSSKSYDKDSMQVIKDQKQNVSTWFSLQQLLKIEDSRLVIMLAKHQLSHHLQ